MITAVAIVLQLLSTLIVALSLTLGVVSAVRYATDKAEQPVVVLLTAVCWFFAAVAMAGAALGIRS